MGHQLYETVLGFDSDHICTYFIQLKKWHLNFFDTTKENSILI